MSTASSATWKFGMQNIVLRSAIPLVRTHGFTRKTLALAALSLPTPHDAPLSETAVSALFGAGDDARRTLVKAWLDEGLRRMGDRAPGGRLAIREALRARLAWNEPVLGLLPEAFALLAIPRVVPPVMDISSAISHPLDVANEACFLAGDDSIGTTWYTQRACLALIYTAAELHQLTSPTTAMHFLDSLLSSSDHARSAVTDVGQFAEYFARSWIGIIRSKGLF